MIPTTLANGYDYFYYGCLADTGYFQQGRTLEGIDYIGNPNNTVEECLQFCNKNDPYQFAGVEFGGECWCGNVIDPEGTGTGAPVPNGVQRALFGELDRICGAAVRIQVYQVFN